MKVEKNTTFIVNLSFKEAVYVERILGAILSLSETDECTGKLIDTLNGGSKSNIQKLANLLDINIIEL